MTLLITEVTRAPEPLTFEAFLGLVGVSETPLDAMLTVDEISKLLQISRTTLYGWIADGHGPRHFRVQNQIRVRFDDFLAWIEENTSTGGDDGGDR
ncbi:MAG TPA: helix-turn-helix domain-containing protein [Thermoanaerobaculales bacterium]|nr:helix-turn-helix domain-containing protein [Thermoanaerobaculales bacterium]